MGSRKVTVVAVLSCLHGEKFVGRQQFSNSQGGHSFKSENLYSKWVPYRGPSSYPEFDKEEGIGWPPFKELLQAPFLLRELVIDLPDIHCLEVGVIVAGA